MVEDRRIIVTLIRQDNFQDRRSQQITAGGWTNDFIHEKRRENISYMNQPSGVM